MVLTAYDVEVIFSYLFLAVLLTSFLFFIREVILLFIFMCKCRGWNHLYEVLLASLPYKYKRKYFHIYEGIVLPKEEE